MTEKFIIPENREDVEAVPEDNPLRCDECGGKGIKLRGYVGGDDDPTWPEDAHRCFKCKGMGTAPLPRMLRDVAGRLSSFKGGSLDTWARRVTLTRQELKDLADHLEGEE